MATPQRPARRRRCRDADEPINPLELIIREGGLPLIVILIVILIVSIISMAFALERFLGLRRVKVVPRRLIAGLNDLLAQKGGLDPALGLQTLPAIPIHHGQRGQGDADEARPAERRARADTIEEVSEREASRLYANVRWQNLAFNVAPMLGLLGTTLGMISAFYVTSHLGPDVSKAERLATGIYTALVNRSPGLAVAIVAAILATCWKRES